jgi:hypothetical protein
MTSTELTEIARKADAVYETRLRILLESAHFHEYVAIEPESGEHFLGQTLSAAIQSARAAYPARVPFARHVGHAATVHFEGFGRVNENIVRSATV